MNKDKQEIKDIINEIDTIMFGGGYKKTVEEIIVEVAPATVVGALIGIVINIAADSPSNIPLYSSLGAIAGGTLGGLGLKNTKENIYKDYELAYLHLPREKQIEVLKLSKRLLKLYQNELQTRRNKKSINKYLQISDKDTMFDQFEAKQPQFKISTKEEKENIDKKNKLVKEETFNEWIKNNYCPEKVDSNFKCGDYESCRDCTVAWEKEKVKEKTKNA